MQFAFDRDHFLDRFRGQGRFPAVFHDMPRAGAVHDDNGFIGLVPARQMFFGQLDDQFKAFVDSEIDRWGEIVKKSGAKVQ